MPSLHPEVLRIRKETRSMKRTSMGGSTPPGMLMPGGTTLLRTALLLACVHADV